MVKTVSEFHRNMNEKDSHCIDAAALCEGIDEISYHEFNRDRMEYASDFKAYFMEKVNDDMQETLKELLELICTEEVLVNFKG